MYEIKLNCRTVLTTGFLKVHESERFNRLTFLFERSSVGCACYELGIPFFEP